MFGRKKESDIEQENRKLRAEKAALQHKLEKQELLLELGTRDLKLSKDDQIAALKLLATHPLDTYLLAWLDELMRQGVYLKQEYTTDNVRFLANQLLDLITEGRRLENEGLRDNKRRTR